MIAALIAASTIWPFGAGTPRVRDGRDVPAAGRVVRIIQLRPSHIAQLVRAAARPLRQSVADGGSFDMANPGDIACARDRSGVFVINLMWMHPQGVRCRCARYRTGCTFGERQSPKWLSAAPGP